MLGESISNLRLRLQALLKRRQLDRDLEEELAHHLAMRERKYQADGLATSDVHSAARRRFGNATLLKEACREMWTFNSFERFWQDVRYGLRMLRKNPGFTAVAILTLALGIGANTAIFSVVNGVLLNPLPYPEPDKLASIYSRNDIFGQSSVSYPNFLDWQRENRAFTAIAAFRNDDFSLTGSGQAARVPVRMISADYFSILGVQPALGRFFQAQEDRLGAPPLAILTEGFWKRRFGSDPNIIGTSVLLNGAAYNIIGVAPSNFAFFGQPDLYVPIGQWSEPQFRERQISMGMYVAGRMKPGITTAQVRADLDRVARNLAAAYPDADAGTGIALVPLKEDMVGFVQRDLMILLGAVAFVLLICCVNVANLLLARTTGRARELSIRLALGASKGRVIRQLLTESVLLGIMGGAIGLAVAAWGTKAALAALPNALPRMESIHVDARVLIFTFAASILAGVIFGLAPAFLTMRPELHETLKEGGRGLTGGRHRTQNVFVIAEISLALVLLIGAGLLIRSLSNLWNVNPGFTSKNLLSFRVALSPNVKTDPAKIRNLFAELTGRVGEVPGVRSAASMIGSLPLSGSDSEIPFWLSTEPKPASENQMRAALIYAISPDYFRAMDIPLLHGRELGPQDNETAPLTVIIDENMARELFPGQEPVGKHLNLDFIGPAEIVGVAGHVKHWGLDTDSTAKIHFEMYFSYRQVPDQFASLLAGNSSYMVVRTVTPPGGLVEDIRRAVTSVDSQQVMYGISTMDEVISDSLAQRRFLVAMLGGFAGLALLLATIGIYGVISYLVAQRSHEIGLRMALGAQRRDVLQLVLSHGGKLALAGIACGLLASIGLTRLMKNFLYGVRATDPLTFTGVAILLMFVALLACYLPARRAMQVDPMVALRHE